MVSDGHSSSVRVDLDESEDGPTPEGPSADRSGSSKAIIFVGLALALVAIAFFLLRPPAGSAADGTVRETPTTVPAAEEAPTTTEATVVEQVVEIVPTRVTAPSPLQSVVARDVGFLALANGIAQTPTILRSLDGQDWNEVDVSTTSLGVTSEVDRVWFGLANEGGRLQLRGTVREGGNFLFRPDIFVSEIGTEWAQVEGIGSLSEIPVPDTPFAVRDTHYFALGFSRAERVNRFVSEHTNLGTEGQTYCFISLANPQGVDGPAFQVHECSRGGETLTLDASDVSSSFSTDEVLGCAATLSFLNFSNAVVVQDFGAEAQRTTLDIGPGRFPASLRSGDIALVDSGFRPPPLVQRCEGLLDFGPATDPSVLVVDQEGATRWPLPEVPDATASLVSDAVVLGELESESENLTIIVAFNDALWSLDTATGEWSDFFLSSENAPLGDFDSEVQLSDSGRRVYSISDGRLVAISLDATDDEALWTSVPIVSTAGFDGGTIIYATDEVLLVSSGADTWLLEAPAN